jgi:pimeloyl-ACP methyl ester carboxylesterase
MSAQTKPTIVFCHGIWADGSCFNKVIPALQADGYEVIAVQYGLDSFEEDLATVKRTLNRVGSPVLLVGHSYGGATITGSGTDERVVGLVYIAAVAPDAGETVQDQLDKYPSDIFSRVEVADGRAWMLPSGTEFFAGDLSEEDQKLVWATHYAPVYNLFQQQKLSAEDIAWRSKPSWYILATQDHTVHPDLQRWVSKRMGATVTEVASSHVPMLSQPAVVIDVIRKAAAAVQKS